jgi:hypothetical protein
MSNFYKLFVEKPERKKSLVAHWRSWDDNIAINLENIEWYGLD